MKDNVIGSVNQIQRLKHCITTVDKIEYPISTNDESVSATPTEAQ